MRSRDLFDRIASFEALHAAALRAARAKRGKPGVAAFLANLEREVLRLERELKSGSYRPGRYTKIEIFDPKHRIVSAAPFRDRVVHHAFCGVCEPIFERGFIHDSYANRVGKGTHRAVARYEKFRDRSRYVLRCDIFRYFHTIDHEILKRDLRRRLACERTLDLADRIIDGSNPQEPVYQLFPGDDLLTPLERRRGLPIGNLTSQFFSNLYLDCMDHFAKEVLRAKGYVRLCGRLRGVPRRPGTARSLAASARAVPGGAAVAASPAQDGDPGDFGAGEVPGLRPAARRPAAPAGGQRAPVSQPAPRPAGPLAARQRQRGRSAPARSVLDRPCRARGHLASASNDLPRRVVRPGAGAWLSPRRVLRGGSWNNKPRNLRSANRNRNTTDNRNNNNGFRVARTLSSPSRRRYGDAGSAVSVQGGS